MRSLSTHTKHERLDPRFDIFSPPSCLFKAYTQPPPMQHEAHHVPVTALAWLELDVLLAGEGNFLCAYDSSFERLLDKQLVFPAQALHGIVLNDRSPEDRFRGKGLAWGGTFYRRLHIELDLVNRSPECQIGLEEVHDIDDWILDAAFAPDSTTIALITAHNTLWLSRPSTGDVSAKDECLVPGSNCILYSAHLRWLSASSCLVAAGTALGDVVLWSAALGESPDKCSARTQVHYTFSAHAGSLFGVHISPWVLLPEPHSKQRMLLASCSDDRNIKLWDISDLTSSSLELTQIQQGAEDGIISHETGQTSPPLIAQVMGHLSRIWNVRYGPVNSGHPKLDTILSSGEDATFVKWELIAAPTNSPTPYIMKMLGANTAHAGKNIWAVTEASGAGRLATGGADGAIASYSLLRPPLQTAEIPRSHLQHWDQSDNYKTYDLVGAGSLVSTTEQGRIVLISMPLEEAIDTEFVSEPLPGLRGYSIVKTVGTYVFLAGKTGCVYAYVRQSGQLSMVADLNKKTAALFGNLHAPDRPALLVTSVGENTALLLLLNDSNGVNALFPVQEIKLALPTGFIVTSCTFHRIKNARYALLGARNGAIAIFVLGHPLPPEPVQPVQIHERVHAKEAVTALHCVDSDTGEEQPYLLSTGRDGTFAVHRIDASNTIELHLVHQLLLPFGPNIENLRPYTHPDRRHHRLWVWGFQSTNFVMYDLLAEREVVRVDCGGAHRNWAFSHHNAGGDFVWTKATKVYHRRQHLLQSIVIHGGGHGRQIKSIAVASLSDGSQIIATGAEDTNIKLLRFAKEEFRCVHTLRKHNTGIQHLQWSSDGRYLFSSGGFEEFFVWKVGPGVPYLGFGVVCKSKHPRSGLSDLRIMGFDVRERGPGCFNISMAYSDSTIKLWQFADKAWQLLGSAEYLTACLTQIFALGGGGAEMFTTATDGHLIRWTTYHDRQQLRWTTRHKVHQSAIHVATSCALPDGSRLIITGGDDNAIGLTRLLGSDFQTLLLPRAHAAAVTGLAIVPVSTEKFLLTSASIDQRIKLWEVSIDVIQAGLEGVNVKKLQDVFTAVADVSGLELCRLEDGKMGLLVCGVGMDLWRLPEVL